MQGDDLEPRRVADVQASEQLRQELLAEVNELASPKHRGPEISESAQAEAKRIDRKGLKNTELDRTGSARPPQRRCAARPEPRESTVTPE